MSGKSPNKGGDDKKFAFNFGGEEGKAVESLVPLIQKKLSTVVGASSGYFESLPKSVQNRVRALRKLQEEKEAVDVEYEKEKLALEKKYREKYAPFFSKRTDIVTGVVEPPYIPEEKKDDEKKDEEKKEEKKEEAKADDVKGIPEFWLEALKHTEDFEQLISERDEECLKFLKDIRVKHLEDKEPSFALEFTFDPNPFFDETNITKTYFLFHDEHMGETMFDHVDSTKITWKPGKNLTVEKKTKTAKAGRGGKRGGRGGRGGGAAPQTITVEEPCQSFFNFFNPEALMNMMNAMQGQDEEEEMDEEGMEQMLEYDYELGLLLKEQVIPNALKYFTGEAQLGMEFSDGEDEEGEEGEEGEDEEGEDEEEHEGHSHSHGHGHGGHSHSHSHGSHKGGNKGAGASPAPGGANPECKQQ